MERLLTALLRQDRFVEGLLGEAFESGLLTRIVRRASVLSEMLDETERAAGYARIPEFDFDLSDE